QRYRWWRPAGCSRGESGEAEPATRSFAGNDPLTVIVYVETTEEVQMAQTHLSGEDFGSILPDDVDWRPFPAFPPTARLAVVVGDPTGPGLYTTRVKVPTGVKLMPHTHPEDRLYTVISGVFYIGLGEQFDPERLQAYPPGAVVSLPGGTAHFHW